MSKMFLRLGLGSVLVLGTTACNRASYVTLPTAETYHRASGQPATANPIAAALPSEVEPQRKTWIAPARSKRPAACLPVAPRPMVAKSRPARVAYVPAAVTTRIGKKLRKAMLPTLRRNTAAVHEANPYKGIWTIILIGLGLLIVGLVGLFVLSIVWLQILAGVIAFIGLLLSFGLFFALS